MLISWPYQNNQLISSSNIRIMQNYLGELCRRVILDKTNRTK